MRTLLDTHAWLWWVSQDIRLSSRARSTIESGLRDDDVWVSLISVWELAKKIEKMQLVLDRPLDDWLDVATACAPLWLAVGVGT